MYRKRSDRPVNNRLACHYDEAHVGIIQIMSQKISSLFAPVITSLLLFFPGSVRAEFVCSSDISYRWVRSDSAVEQQERTSSKDDKAEAPTAVPVTPPPAAAASQVRYATVERGGGDEAAAKTSLGIELSRQKARASERCKREHESFGECLATKMSVKGSVLNSLSFSARAQLEKALTEECQLQQGRCLGVDSSEPVCREVVKADKAEKGAPAVEVKSGDESKKPEEAAKGAEPAAAAKSDSKSKTTAAKK